MIASVSKELGQQLIANIERVVVGKTAAVRLAVLSLLAGGHVLMEDVPGIGKTILARSLARSIHADFKRIKCTPDLLPSDVTGVSIFNPQARAFEFKRGPIFTNILLADEINRATPRTQSSLLEAMEERTVSVDGVTNPLPRPFFLIATQNPIELQGTFPLPEAQLDRFLLSITLGYPAHADEVQILSRQMTEHPLDALQPVVSLEQVQRMQQDIRQIFVDESIKGYLVQLCARTRQHEDVLLGASPRASLALLRASQAATWLAGESYVLPDTVKLLAPAVLSHRIILKPRARMTGRHPADIVRGVLTDVEVPVR